MTVNNISIQVRTGEYVTIVNKGDVYIGRVSGVFPETEKFSIFTVLGNTTLKADENEVIGITPSSIDFGLQHLLIDRQSVSLTIKSCNLVKNESIDKTIRVRSGIMLSPQLNHTHSLDYDWRLNPLNPYEKPDYSLISDFESPRLESQELDWLLSMEDYHLNFEIDLNHELPSLLDILRNDYEK
jgi:hypothetical protein